jgi:hypothetical protein
VTVEGRRLDPTTLASLDEPALGIRGVAGRGDLAMASDGQIALVLVGGTFVRVRLSDGVLLDSTPVIWSTADARHPAVVFDGASFTVVWEGELDNLRILRIAPSGVVLDDGDGGAEVGRRICYYGFRPQLVAHSPNPILLFGGGTVYGTRIDPVAGTSLDATPGGACGLDLGLSFVPDRPSPFHAVASDGALFVTAYGQARAFDSSSLQPEQQAWIVPTWYADAAEVGAASNGDEFLVAWVTTRRSGPNAAMQVLLAMRLDSAGAVLDPEPEVLYEGGSPMKVSVASSGNDYIVAWLDNRFSSPDRICATRVRASDGTRVDGTATSCGMVLDQQDDLWQVAVSGTGTDYLLAWRRYRGGSVSGALFPADPDVAPGPHGFIADVAVAPAEGGRYVLLKGGASGGVESTVIDPATRNVSAPLAISTPGAYPEILRMVAGTGELLALWGRHNTPTTPEQLRPSFARLSSVDGRVLAPGVSFLRTLHPLDRAYFFAAHDGRHLWTAWLQDVGLHQQDLVGTRLDSMGRFLDGPGPTGAFPILRADWLWDAELAPDARGRLLVLDSSLDRSLLTRRIRARFIQTSPEELDGGIEYHPYPIPDGAPFPQAEAGEDAGSGGGGGQPQRDATASDGAAVRDSGTGGAGRDAAPGRDGAASPGDARANGDTSITPGTDASNPGDGSANDASSGGGTSGSGSGGATTSGGTSGTGTAGRQVGGAGGRQVGGAGGAAPTDGGDSGVIEALEHSGDSSGCGCAVPRDRSANRAWLPLLCAAAFVARRRKARVGARSGTPP